MNKLPALALLGCLCGSALAQTPAPAATAQTTAPAAGAAAAPAAPATAASTGSSGDRNALYTDRIPPEQIVALDASGDKFQARRIADLSGLPRGAVIILHDSGQHPSWPFTAAALIDELPLHGWDTLAIELPTPAAAAKPETASTAANTAAPTATAAPAAGTNPVNTAAPAPNAATASQPNADTELRAQARISAAISYFFAQNQRNIVLIGFGSGAIRAAENLRSIATANTAKPGDTTPISALVMIAPQQQLQGIDMDLAKLLPLTGIPAFDLALDSDGIARAEAEARRRAVLHQRTRIYTRLELPPLNNASSAQHSTMVKRVRSWLQVNAQPAPAEAKRQPVAQP